MRPGRAAEDLHFALSANTLSRARAYAKPMWITGHPPARAVLSFYSLERSLSLVTLPIVLQAEVPLGDGKRPKMVKTPVLACADKLIVR
jgi:hypothetical protein